MGKKALILFFLLIGTICNAQKVYHMVTYEVQPNCVDSLGQQNTIIFEIPVDAEYYNCVSKNQIVTNFFPCRNLKIVGYMGYTWKIVIINKRIGYE